MYELRDKLIDSINKTVDEHQTLGADNIADGILGVLQCENMLDRGITIITKRELLIEYEKKVHFYHEGEPLKTHCATERVDDYLTN